MNYIIVLAEVPYSGDIVEQYINVNSIASFYDVDTATHIILSNGERVVTRSAVAKQLKSHLAKLGHQITRLG